MEQKFTELLASQELTQQMNDELIESLKAQMTGEINLVASAAMGGVA